MTDQLPSERFAGAAPGIRSELRVFRDRLEYDPGGFGGLLRGTKNVSYEDVDLVLRRDGRLDPLLGSGSYDLIRSGEPTVRLHHVADTEGAERALDGRIPGPHERVEATDDEAVRTALQRERVAWRHWPEDEPLPRSAVVTDSELTATYGDTERPERPEISRPSDSRPSDVTAADFENGAFPGGGGSGSADFTGGSARHSPGHASNEGGAESNVGSDGATDMGDGGM